MRLVHVIWLCLLMYSCTLTQPKEVIVSSFPHTEKLSSEVCRLPVPIFVPRFMGVTGDFLYIYKEREEQVFVTFHIPEMLCLGNMGNRGQGPNDFNLLDTRSFSATDEGFQVMEAGSNMLKDVILTDKGIQVRNSKQCFGQGYNSNGFYPLEDGKYLTLGQLDDEQEFAIYDTQKDSLFSVGYYPQWHELSKGEIPFVIYLKTCAVHPSLNKVAVFYSKFKRMRIFDSSMNLLHDVNVQQEPYRTNWTAPEGKYPVYYIGKPYVTEQCIYALCSLSNTEKQGNSELHVWDWNGNPIACYDLGRRISLFAVSEKVGKIYALDNAIEDEIYVYDLPVITNGKTVMQ